MDFVEHKHSSYISNYDKLHFGRILFQNDDLSSGDKPFILQCGDSGVINMKDWQYFLEESMQDVTLRPFSFEDHERYAPLFYSVSQEDGELVAE